MYKEIIIYKNIVMFITGAYLVRLPKTPRVEFSNNKGIYAKVFFEGFIL